MKVNPEALVSQLKADYPQHSARDLMFFLEDGGALAGAGFSDEDLEVIEQAYLILETECANS